MLAACAPVARAEVAPAGVSGQTFPMWWSEPGRPGWRPEAALSDGTPWTIAGLTAGAWELRDPFAPATLPAPGMAEAQAPLAWFDSATVVIGEGAAWTGFEAGLAVAEARLRPTIGRRPRAVFTSTSGQAGLDRTGILLTRGDPQVWMRGGAVAGRRGGIADMGIAGDHLWTVAVGTRRGAHVLDASFAQRGIGEAQRLGVGESGRGQSGAAGWTWAHGGDSVTVRLARGFDGRQLVPVNALLVPMRRDAAENTFEVTASRATSRVPVGLRLAWRDGRVVQRYGVVGGPVDRYEWRTRSTWLAARTWRPLAQGQLELTLGAGHDDSPALARDRDVLAPAAAWTFRRDDRHARVFFERVVTPVWSDLDAFTAPFLQHTWTGGFEAGVDGSGPATGRMLVVAGRTANRATLLRSAVRAQSLGVGWQQDARRYNFLLMEPSLAATWQTFTFDASGYALGRGRASGQTRVDPVLGGRAGLGRAFRLFDGDMRIRLRAQAAYVGVRETDTRNEFFPDGLLPGYGTYAATAAIAVGDATIVLRVDGLENERRPLTWQDFSREGFPLALDSGRQYRFELVWPLFN